MERHQQKLEEAKIEGDNKGLSLIQNARSAQKAKS